MSIEPTKKQAERFWFTPKPMNETLLHHFKQLKAAKESKDFQGYNRAVEDFRRWIHSAVSQDLYGILEELCEMDDEEQQLLIKD